jgi:hypothetical protein
MKAFPKHVSSAVFTGKAKTINWIAINLMLKYSDMFLEGCRMTNVAPQTQIFLRFYAVISCWL